MRTNIDIDDDLMAETMKATGATTKKAAVEAAMRAAVKAAAFKDLVEGMRGIAWNDELGEPTNITELAETAAPFGNER